MFSGLTNLSNLASTMYTNSLNAQSTALTNKTNLQIARETNAANVEQANLAYERSKPVTQVANLMNAGMSKAGALNSLTGGGTYSAPVLQATSLDPMKFDPIQMNALNIMEAVDKLLSIPQNVQQQQINDENIALLRQEFEHRQNEEERKQDIHDFNNWQNQYGKESAQILDRITNKVFNALIDSNKDIQDFKSFDDLIRSLNLADDEDYRNMPAAVRSQVESSVRSRFDEYRNSVDFKNRVRSADDSHDLAEFNKTLAKLDISEKQRSLVYKLGILANQLELSNLQVDDANKDAIIRDAGFENEKEAHEALKAAENLRARESKRHAVNQANFDNDYKGFMEFLDYTLDKVNPLKNLLSFK